MNFPKYPYQPFDDPIPAPPDDRGALCFQLDAKWKPYLVGLLKTLLIDRTWESDADRATGEASLLLEHVLTADFCPVVMPGIEMEDCMGCCIRVQDGVLQVFSCGEWSDVPGGNIAQIATGTSQPAQGAPQPAAGDCEQFIGKVLFFGRWLLPVPVDAGDTIRVTNAFGATTDYLQDGPRWNCGDGNEFIAGGCLNGSAGFNGGDPYPAAHHGNLIGTDGTNFYDFGEAANSQVVEITIPSGISGANFAMLINAEGPAGAGDLSFDIRICKGVGQYWSSGAFDTSTDHIDTPFSTVAGAQYKITTTGHVCHNPFSTNQEHDTIYSSSDGFATHSVDLFGSGPLFYGILMDTQNLPVVPFRAGHDYTFTVTGTGNPFVFKPVANSPYGSCGGSFTVTVEQLTA